MTEVRSFIIHYKRLSDGVCPYKYNRPLTMIETSWYNSPHPPKRNQWILDFDLKLLATYMA